MAKGIAYIRTSAIYNDSRAQKEILSLEKHGYTIYVFGWNRDGKANEKCAELFKDRNVHCSFFEKPITGVIGGKNLLKLLSFFKWSYKQLKRYKDNFDYVHICDLDSGIGKKRFCKKYKKKMVYDIYDYYVDSHSLPKILKNIVEKQEIKLINFADATIICTEERRIQINKAKPKQIYIIFNSPEINENINIPSAYDYVYCGIFDDVRLIAEILEEYKNHSGLKFRFAGVGRLQDKVQATAETYENFDYVGSISYNEVLELEKKAKVISAIYKPTLRNHQLCAPNKFYEALALGKPVIVCKGTGIDKIVEAQQIGLVIDYDAAQFYDAVKKLIENPSLLKSMGERGRSLYEKEYKWSIMETRLIKMYQSLEMN